MPTDFEDEEFVGELSPNIKKTLKESGLSGSGGKTPEAESVSGEEYNMDLEEETPDTTIKKTSGKKQKKGIEVRARINAAAVEMVREEQPDVEVKKWKAGPGTSTEAELT